MHYNKNVKKRFKNISFVFHAVNHTFTLLSSILSTDGNIICGEDSKIVQNCLKATWACLFKQGNFQWGFQSSIIILRQVVELIRSFLFYEISIQTQ